MKNIAYLLGVLLIVVAAIYLLVPADQLPWFFPGADADVAAHPHQARAHPRRGRHRAGGAWLVLRPPRLNACTVATIERDRRQNSIASSNCSRVNGLCRQQVAPRSIAVRKKSCSARPLPPA